MPFFLPADLFTNRQSPALRLKSGPSWLALRLIPSILRLQNCSINSGDFPPRDETVQARREEDNNAASLVGATTVHFDFLDCIYRRDENGEWPYYDIYLPLQKMDADLPRQIADAIIPRLNPDDVLVCQLSVGSHIDHVLVRQAAELLERPLLYDIDLPYIFYKPEELAPKSAGMKENAHAVTETGLKAWQEAVLVYKSQLPVLGEAMSTPEDARESIQSYWGEQKGIYLFQRI